MCYKATCQTCQKSTWNGCGSHVPSVLDHIPKDQWCTCEPKFKVGAKEYPPQSTGGGFFSGLFGWGGATKEL